MSRTLLQVCESVVNGDHIDIFKKFMETNERLVKNKDVFYPRIIEIVANSIKKRKENALEKPEYQEEILKRLDYIRFLIFGKEIKNGIGKGLETLAMCNLEATNKLIEECIENDVSMPIDILISKLKMDIECNQNPKNTINALLSPNEIILRKRISDIKSVLCDLINSNTIFKISLSGALKILEFIHSDEFRFAPTFERPYQHELQTIRTSENDESILEKLHEIVKRSFDITDNELVEESYERLIVNLFELYDFYDDKIDEIIADIIKNKKLDLTVNPVTYQGPQDLEYWLAISNSTKILEEFLKIPNLPPYFCNDIKGVSLCSLYAKIGDYKKAKECFDDERYVLLDDEDEASLMETGSFENHFLGFIPLDKEEILSLLKNSENDESDERTEFFSYVFKSPKLRFIDINVLAQVNFTLSSIILERYKNKDIQFTIHDDDNKNVKLASQEEIDEYFSVDELT